MIVTDGHILRGIFSNLLENATKFTKAGSITFGYQAPVNNTITCYVTDTGIGISPENHKLIFDPFRQAEGKRADMAGGTGLGLSICQGTLSLLGGSIKVESEPGKGSTFIFTLPFEHQTARSVTRATGPSPVARKYNWAGKRLLLVEDEEANMEYLKIILGRTGAELVPARNGSRLRELYGVLETFDLILLDIRLPDASGWDLAREIKSICPLLPIIAQTAFAMPSDLQKGEESGCDGYISKPISREKLLEMAAGYIEV